MANSLSEVGSQDLLVVPSHGASLADLTAAHQRGIEVLDLTCPRVRRSEEAAASFAAAGRRVIVIGDPAHAEVRAVASYGGPDTVVIGDIAAVSELPSGLSWGVITQTTMRIEDAQRILQAIVERSARVDAVPTTCQVAAQMQETVRSLATSVDIVLVVGGKASANTANLAAIARGAGVPTYYIEQASELDQAWFYGLRKVGVAAGASTPDWLIEEVVTKVMEIDERELEQQDQAPESEQAEPAVVTEEAPAAPEASQEAPDSMEAVKMLSAGDVVPGRVVAVRDGEGVMVDVGYKSEGLVPLNELARRSVSDPLSLVKVGDEIMVQVLKLEGEEGTLILSKRRADEEHTWGSLQAASATGEPVTGRVTQAVKGGLLVDVGVRAFLPASHVGTEFVRELNPYVGKDVTVKVIEIDRKERKVILSERQYLEEARRAAADAIWDSLTEGRVLTGTVKRLTDFGAFVDLGGVDGLLHISELSWGRVNHPSEVVKEGEQIEVKILRVDRDRNRISLGRKQLEADPWSQAVRAFSAGSVVEGTVVRLVPFGAFVQLADGVDGLVHISQIADHRIAKPDEVLQAGQQVKVKVLSVSPDTKRISLSIKEAEQDRGRSDYRSYLAQQPTGEVTVGEMLAARLAGDSSQGGTDDDKPKY